MVWGRFSPGKIYGLGPTDGFGEDGRTSGQSRRTCSDLGIWDDRRTDLGRTDGGFGEDGRTSELRGSIQRTCSD
jgi:hypothetical protein